MLLALYVFIDDLLKADAERVPWRPATGIVPHLSDAEALTLSVLQPLLGFASEARWLRHAPRAPAAPVPVPAAAARVQQAAAFFWGLRLHLLYTLHGLPVGFALTGAKADERLVLLDILADPGLTAGRPAR